jgi:hypothetical protein
MNSVALALWLAAGPECGSMVESGDIVFATAGLIEREPKKARVLDMMSFRHLIFNAPSFIREREPREYVTSVPRRFRLIGLPCD